MVHVLLVVLMVWVAASIVIAPLVGLMLRRLGQSVPTPPTPESTAPGSTAIVAAEHVETVAWSAVPPAAPESAGTQAPPSGIT